MSGDERRRAGPPTTCTVGIIYYLDQARAAMGLGAYALPADFPALTPAEQMFVLSNLDRVAYSLPPLEGLSEELDAAAIQGALRDADPEPPPGTVDQPSYAFTGNWAGGFSSAVEAYFFWMYADGPDGGNLDCLTPTSEGCWDHRHDILFTVPPAGEHPIAYRYSMGAAATQAVAEGAGTNVFPAAPASAEQSA